MMITFMLLVVSAYSVMPNTVQMKNNVCTYMESNYRIKELTKTVKTTEDCGFLRKVADFWIFWNDLCVKGKRIIYRGEKYTKQTVRYTIKRDCCRGYYNDSGSCRQDCENGTYGQNCSKKCECPENAFPACDKDSGNCTCKSGYTGASCKEECSNEHFGVDCKHKCPCENNSTCDRTDGRCNCTSPGWTGQYCNQVCPYNTYGLNCSSECDCQGNQICDHVSGCLCQAGFTGLNCNESCGGWKYGPNCRETCVCSQQFTNSCDAVNGTCHCKPGYIGLDCSDFCRNGTYGHNCEEQCDCSPHQFCLPTNGSCYCPLGLKGEFCNETCSHWTFGLGCGGQCSCVRNSTLSCNQTDGHCFCKEGWDGTTCQTYMHSGQFSNTDSDNSEMTNSKSKSVMYPLIGGAIAILLIGIILAVIIRKRKTRRQKNIKQNDVISNPTYKQQIPKNEDFSLHNNANSGPDGYSHMRLQANDEYDDFKKTPSNNILQSEEYDSVRENFAMGNETDGNYDEFKKSNRSENDVILNDVYDKCGPTLKDGGGYDTFIKSKQQIEGHYD